MTPAQLAIAECANYDQGRCLGVTADSLTSGHLVLAKDRGQCVITAKRCGYFEECVLPMADSDHPDAGEYKTARAAYRTKHGMKQIPEEIRKCICGEMLGKRQRLCAKCATIKRRETFRNSQNRRRNIAVPEIAMSVNS